MSVKVKFRRKRRERYQDVRVNPFGLGNGLISGPLDSFQLVPTFRKERLEYTYNGNRKAFNTCQAYHDNTWGLVTPKRISLYDDVSVGWSEGSSQWIKPSRLTSVVKSVFFLPYVPTKFLEQEGLSERVFDCSRNVKYYNPSTHMNWVRSAVELRDTKQTLKSLRSLINWAQYVGYDRLRPNASAAKVAEAYLTHQFGIAPTAKDVRTFIRQIASEKLVICGKPRRIGKDSIIRSGYKLAPSDDDLTKFCNIDSPIYVDNVVEWIGNNGNFWKWSSNSATKPYIPGNWADRLTRVVSTEYQGVLFARATNNIELPGFGTSTREFVWNCPLVKTLWDTTPFTFLVDWFIGVGDTLKRMERENAIAFSERQLSPVWHSAHSILVERVPRIHCKTVITDIRPAPPCGYPIWYVLCRREAQIASWHADGETKTFTRAPYVEPLTALLPTFRWPLSSYQLSAGAALIMAQGLACKRRRGH